MRKFTIKPLALLLIIIISLSTLPLTAMAAGNGFRNSPDNMAISNAETPTENGSLKWSYQVSQPNEWGADPSAGPVIIGGYIYSVGSNTLFKLNKSDGSFVNSVKLTNNIDYTCFLSSSGGMVFVQETGGVIEAFDANDLHSKWTSPAFPSDILSSPHQGNTPVYYYTNGEKSYVFSGTAIGWNNDKGTYYCVNADNGKILWHFTPENTGFYWAGAVVVNDTVIFGSSNGLFSAAIDSSGELTADTVQRLDINGEICSSIAYDSISGKIYFTTKTGYIYAIPIKEDGTFSEAEFSQFSSESTNTPVICGGKIFIGASKPSKLYVLDALNLSEITSIALNGAVQSSPLISTAYEGKIYIYVTCNTALGGIIMAVYDTASKVIIPYTLFTPEGKMANFCMHSVICDTDGILYYQNDSGYLMAIENNSIDLTSPYLINGNAIRGSDKEAVINFTSSESGKYYYSIVKSGVAAPAVNTTGDGFDCHFGENTINLSNLTPGAKDIYIIEKDSSGNISQQLKIEIPKYANSTAIPITLRVEGISKNLYYDTVEVPYDGQLSVQDALIFIDENDDSITFTGADGEFITAVNDETAAFFGGYDGWLYRVNNVSSSKGISEHFLLSGDTIILYYNDEFGKGMQHPIADTDNILSGKLKFTSQDTVYDENYNPTVLTNPIKGASVTWCYDGGSKTYLTNDNGEITIDREYLTKGNHRIQIEKYDSTAVNEKFSPLILRLPPDYMVNVPNSGGIRNGDDLSDISVTFTLKNVSSSFSNTVTIPKGASVYDVFVKVMNEHGIPYTLVGGNYIKSIAGLSEGDKGSNSGWMYTVNDTHPSKAIKNYTLNVGDVLVFHFTGDYTKEEGSWSSETEFIKIDNNPDIKIPYTKKGNTAALNLNESMLEKMLKSAKDNGNITIDISDISDINAVTLPPNVINTIAPPVNNDNIRITFALPDAAVTFDSEALKSIANQLSDNNVTLCVKKADLDSLNNEQKEAVGDKNIYDITFINGDTEITEFNGKLSISLPYTLKEDENPSGVSIYYLDSAGGITSLECSYNSETGMVTFLTDHLLYYFIGYWPFKDIVQNDNINRYYSGIKFSYEKGLFGGVNSDCFKPNLPMTRAMFITVLARLNKSDLTVYTADAFEDTDIDSWYGQAAAWAKSAEIAKGDGNMFFPDDKITREQMCSLLIRYAEFAGIKLTKKNPFIEFNDADKISGWAYNDITQAHQSGLIMGKSNNTFDPKGIAARAECAEMFYRFIKEYVK